MSSNNTIERRLNDRRAEIALLRSLSQDGERFRKSQREHVARVDEAIEEIWCYVRENQNSLDSIGARQVIKAAIDLALEGDIEHIESLILESQANDARIKHLKKTIAEMKKSPNGKAKPIVIEKTVEVVDEYEPPAHPMIKHDKPRTVPELRQRIKDLRDIHGMTFESIAKRLGFNVCKISRIYRGEIKNPKMWS